MLYRLSLCTVSSYYCNIVQLFLSKYQILTVLLVEVQYRYLDVVVL